MISRVCRVCNQLKISDELVKSKKARDGVDTICKKCMRERAAIRKSTPEGRAKYREIKRNSYQKHKNRYRVIRHENRPKIREYERKRRREHPEKVRQIQRNWERKNSEHFSKIKRVANAQRRARQRGAEGKYTYKDELAIYDKQKGQCYWCGKQLNGKYHVDHVIPLSRNGSNNPDNLVVACPSCNMQKHDKTPEEWTDKPKWKGRFLPPLRKRTR